MAVAVKCLIFALQGNIGRGPDHDLGTATVPSCPVNCDSSVSRQLLEQVREEGAGVIKRGHWATRKDEDISILVELLASTEGKEKERHSGLIGLLDIGYSTLDCIAGPRFGAQGISGKSGPPRQLPLRTISLLFRFVRP